MRKILLYSSGVLAIVVTALVIFREPLKEAAYAALTDDMFVEEDADAFDPGIAVGQKFPPVNSFHKGELVSDIGAFAGPAGTMFMASRSFDWCPYCMRQMKQLGEHTEAFEAAGIGIVVMTYDSPEVHQSFAAEHGITVPMLSDIEAQSFITLGILNKEYAPGDSAYGIPYPGMFVIDPSGVVVGKLFLEAYSSRVNAEAALDYAEAQLAAARAAD